MSADLAAARREAEEALERHNICGARHRANCFCGEVAIEAALRSFLAASEPAPATTCTLCDYGIELRGSGLHSVTPNVFILCAKVLKRAPEPAHALSDEVREAAERADKAMCDVFGGVDQFGDYCGHPIMPAKLAHAVQDLLVALDAAHGGRP